MSLHYLVEYLLCFSLAATSGLLFVPSYVIFCYCYLALH